MSRRFQPPKQTRLRIFAATPTCVLLKGSKRAAEVTESAGKVIYMSSGQLMDGAGRRGAGRVHKGKMKVSEKSCIPHKSFSLTGKV